MRVTIQEMILATAAIGALLVSAGCAPYGGAPLIPARAEGTAIPGYRVESIDIVSRKEGVLIHGRICRKVATVYPISRLSVEHVGPDGHVIEHAEANLYGMASWRKPSCGYYSVETNWKVDESDTIRVGHPRGKVR